MKIRKLGKIFFIAVVSTVLSSCLFDKTLPFIELGKSPVVIKKAVRLFPPRNASDIVKLVNDWNLYKAGIGKQAENRLIAVAPEKAFVEDNLDRMNSAIIIGNYRDAVDELTKALVLADKTPGFDLQRKALLWNTLEILRYWLNDYNGVIQTSADNIRHYGSGVWPNRFARSFSKSVKSMSHLALSEYDEAGQEYLQARRDNAIMSKLPWKKLFCLRLQKMMRAVQHMNDGKFLEVNAEFDKATEFYDKALVELKQELHTGERELAVQIMFAEIYRSNARRLQMKGRLQEAEMLLRQAVWYAREQLGDQFGLVAPLLNDMAEVLYKQEKLEDARRISEALLAGYANNKNQLNELNIFTSGMILAKTLFAQKKYPESLAEYQKLLALAKEEPYLQEMLINAGVELPLLFAVEGYAAESLALVEPLISRYEEMLGHDSWQTLQAYAVEAVAMAWNGEREKALAGLSVLVKKLVKEKNKRLLNSPYENIYLRFIAETYFSLLADMKAVKQQYISAEDESFAVANMILESETVLPLIKAMELDAVAENELCFITKQIKKAREEASFMMALYGRAKAEKTKKAIKNILKSKEKRLDYLFGTMTAKHHDFDTLFNPEILTMKEAEKWLADDESLIVTFSGREELYAWAVAKDRPAYFYRTGLSEAMLANTVSGLRESLSPSQSYLKDIPDFDFEKAHMLYRMILYPSVKTWLKNSNIVIAADGALRHIPFSVFPVAKTPERVDLNLLFTKYRYAPWLVRTHTESRISSANRLKYLRTRPLKDRGDEVFVSFADALFSGEKKEPPEDKRQFGLRNLRKLISGDIDSYEMLSVKPEGLYPLPETKKEAIGLSYALGTQDELNLYLGKDAYEKRFNSSLLSNRQYISFASHVLNKWDTDGQIDGAIALTKPAFDSGEDGLFMPVEIMNQNFVSDAVVLTGTDTFSGNGKGAETLLEMETAFSLAGNKSMLASMCPVFSSSAKKIVSDFLRLVNLSYKVRKDKALQKARLHMIEKGVFKDAATGENIFSFAHPLFWSSISLYGDNLSTGPLKVRVKRKKYYSPEQIPDTGGVYR